MTPAHIVVFVLTTVTVILLVVIERRSRRNTDKDRHPEVELESRAPSRSDIGP